MGLHLRAAWRLDALLLLLCLLLPLLLLNLLLALLLNLLLTNLLLPDLFLSYSLLLRPAGGFLGFPRASCRLLLLLALQLLLLHLLLLALPLLLLPVGLGECRRERRHQQAQDGDCR